MRRIRRYILNLTIACSLAFSIAVGALWLRAWHEYGDIFEISFGTRYLRVTSVQLASPANASTSWVHPPAIDLLVVNGWPGPSALDHDRFVNREEPPTRFLMVLDFGQTIAQRRNLTLHRGTAITVVGADGKALDRREWSVGAGDSSTKMSYFAAEGLPHWQLMLCGLALPVARGLVALRRARARRFRRRNGLCIRCGYDKRATVDRCPECGTEEKDAAKPLRPTLR